MEIASHSSVPWCMRFSRYTSTAWNFNMLWLIFCCVKSVAFLLLRTSCKRKNYGRMTDSQYTVFYKNYAFRSWRLSCHGWINGCRFLRVGESPIHESAVQHMKTMSRGVFTVMVPPWAEKTEISRNRNKIIISYANFITLYQSACLLMAKSQPPTLIRCQLKFMIILTASVNGCAAWQKKLCLFLTFSDFPMLLIAFFCRWWIIIINFSRWKLIPCEMRCVATTQSNYFHLSLTM